MNPQAAVTTSSRIALVSQPLLTRRYGASGAQTVLSALAGLDGTKVVVSTGATAPAIRKDLQAALQEAPDAAVLLVGGPATLPFFEVPITPKVDADAVVGTDNPYGVPGASLGLSEIGLPPRAVGRIPDNPDDTPQTFAARLTALCAPGAPNGSAPLYVLAAKVWKGTTAAMVAKLSPGASIDLSPPRQPSDFRPTLPAGARHLFNLHGSDRDRRWFGQDGGSYPPALDPAAIASAGAPLAGALVVSQACYGAFLFMPGGLRTATDACSLQFLEQGATGFLGSTTIAYGGTTGAMVCSDVLAVAFIDAASAGLPLGEALREARRALASTVRAPPAGADLKTLLQFVLYGDPARRWAAPPIAKSLLGQKSVRPDDSSFLPLLAEYAQWVEEALPPIPKSAPSAKSDDDWAETARFIGKAGPVAKSLGATTTTGPLQRQLYEQVRAVSDDVVYFRELVMREDGSSQDARSTGGRAAATLQEERRGGNPWWRQPPEPVDP